MADDTLYVKIRTWDDMLQQYGMHELGTSAINVPSSFTRQMENIMPDDRIIEIQTRPKKNTYLWRYEDGSCIISKEMIEQNYGTTDPRIDTSIVAPTKDTKISEPVFNHTQNAYFLAAEYKYLHADMIIRTSTMPFETGYYPTEQSALFAKLRFERLQQKGLLHDFSKPTNPYYSITDSDVVCSS